MILLISRIQEVVIIITKNDCYMCVNWSLFLYIQSYNKKRILFNHSVYLYGQLNDTCVVYELHEFSLILIHRYNVYILGWMIILGDYIQAIRIWISEYFTFRSTIRSWTTWMWIRRRLHQNGMDLKIGIIPGRDLIIILRRCRELFQMIEAQITLVRHVHSVHRTIRRSTTNLQPLHWVYWYLVITCYMKKISCFVNIILFIVHAIITSIKITLHTKCRTLLISEAQ